MPIDAKSCFDGRTCYFKGTTIQFIISLASYSNAGSLSVVTLFDVACLCVSLSSASFYKVVRLLSILLISTSISCYNGLCTLSQLRTCYINPGRDA